MFSLNNTSTAFSGYTSTGISNDNSILSGLHLALNLKLTLRLSLVFTPKVKLLSLNCFCISSVLKVSLAKFQQQAHVNVCFPVTRVLSFTCQNVCGKKGLKQSWFL